jgi:hypothetical protein
MAPRTIGRGTIVNSIEKRRKEIGMRERVLSRRLAVLSAQEIETVAGGQCFNTPCTVCSTSDNGTPDEVYCDVGPDCDF